MLNQLTRVCLWLVILVALLSCGQTGPLYLPDPGSTQEEEKQ